MDAARPGANIDTLDGERIMPAAGVHAQRREPTTAAAGVRAPGVSYEGAFGCGG